MPFESAACTCGTNGFTDEVVSVLVLCGTRKRFISYTGLVGVIPLEFTVSINIIKL